MGVELGGAVKNVIAIAAGVIDGLGLGLNTRAALITRGLVEIQCLGKRLGADQRTLAGIAGVQAFPSPMPIRLCYRIKRGVWHLTIPLRRRWIVIVDL